MVAHTVSWIVLLSLGVLVRAQSILEDARVHPAGDGSFGFLYRTQDGIAHAAKGDPGGAVHGRFTYTDPTGLKVNFNYNAGAQALQQAKQQPQQSPQYSPLARREYQEPRYERPRYSEPPSYEYRPAAPKYQPAPKYRPAQYNEPRNTRPPSIQQNNVQQDYDYEYYNP